MAKIIVIDDTDQQVAILPLSPREFKTGSRGYRTDGRITLNGETVMVGANFVVAGSKPKFTGK